MRERNLAVWIVASGDPHQSEYPAPHWKTRAWLSGFTGSAGTLVVTPDRAGLWTDSRYFIQAAQQLIDSGIELFKLKMPGVPTHTEWLARELPEGALVGFDSAVMSIEQVDELAEALEAKRVSFWRDEDLAALIWTDRPPIPATPVFLLDIAFSGETRQSKFARIRHEMQTFPADIHLISTLDEIVWMFNIRGSDVEFNPFTIAYAAITNTTARLFIEPAKLSAEVAAALQEDGVSCSGYDEFWRYIQDIPEQAVVLIDPEKTSQAVKDATPDHCVLIGASNIILHLKASKNATELDGTRQAHLRDGVALVKWLYWLQGHVGKEPFTEVSIVEPLNHFRSQQAHFQGLSFYPIVGYQANGAICHYTAAPDSALSIRPEGMLLVDSGAQYLDGTTDITRTIALSPPTQQQTRDFTLVLKGHIALATAKFPQSTSGAQLDALARIALWKEGLQYRHGTGHGIGHFLSVHEGPQGIRPENQTPLELGMICSNEPGLYREGEYGIRIENLIVVIPTEETPFGTFYQFETISLCPLDASLIDATLLTCEELRWVNAYHREVREKISPFLSSEECAYLQEITREISSS